MFYVQIHNIFTQSSASSPHRFDSIEDAEEVINGLNGRRRRGEGLAYLPLKMTVHRLSDDKLVSRPRLV